MMELDLHATVIAVSDVERSKQYYLRLGFRLDVDSVGRAGYRVVHLTSPGSEASIIFGSGVTAEHPGETRGLQLVARDIEAARDYLVRRGANVSDVHRSAEGQPGMRSVVDSTRHPATSSYGAFASFRDPDGNEWMLRERDREYMPSHVVSSR
jgi:catechol 2,3-dioxygenase-like lactoylglutathione lyase family enzyme